MLWLAVAIPVIVGSIVLVVYVLCKAILNHIKGVPSSSCDCSGGGKRLVSLYHASKKKEQRKIDSES